MDDSELKALKDKIEDIENELSSIDVDNEAPVWNASHVGNVPIDTKHKKDGWGFLYNKGKLELFPTGESKFYDHNELTNYKKNEHTPLDDSKTSTQSLWSSKKTLQEIVKLSDKLLGDKIKEAKKQSNITLNKTVKKNRVEIEKNVETKFSEVEAVRRDARILLKRLEKTEDELSVTKDNIAKLGALQNDKSHIDKLSGEIAALETQLLALIDIKVGKVRDVVYTKGELNKKFKDVSERISKISKTVKVAKKENRKLSDKEIKNLIEDRATWGHEHMAKEVKYNGQRLNEYLDNLVTGGDTLPDQTGNSGKFLTTDGTDTSWGAIPGGGDMLAATYDPQAIGGDAFSTDNHTDGTTNKVFTATEKTKLSGIAESANNYSLPTAAAGTLGGVKVGTRLTITDGVLSADSQTENSFTTTLKNKLDGIEAGADVTDAINVSAAGAPIITSGAGAPSSTPSKVGDIYIDTTGDDAYIAVGTASSSDWEKSNDGTGAGGIDDGDKGDITVSGSGATWTIDNSAVTYAKMQNVSATDRILGRDTAGAGVIEELTPTAVRSMINVEDGADVTDATNVSAAGAPIIISGEGNPPSPPVKIGDIYIDTNNGWAYIAVGTASNSDWEKSSVYVHPNHSGDVTSVADGATTIANGAVSLSKMANLAANTIIGRVTAFTGVPEALTAANVRTIINVEDGADVTDATNVASAGAFMKSSDDLDDISAGTTNKHFTATLETKLNGIETAADVTDATNVAAAGAVMDSELIATSTGVTDAGKPIKLDAAGHVDATMINDADISLDSVTEGSTNKFFTSTEKTKLSGIAESANNYSLPTAAADTLGGVKVGTRLTITDGVLSADSQTDNNFTTTLKNKLDGIEASADVTDATNVAAAGAVMDSELIATSAGAGDAGKPIKLDAAGHVDATMINDADISLDSVTEGATNKFYTSTEKTKLSGIAESANNYSHPNHSGDVTSVADGATTIANGAVSLAKMANLAANTIIGRVTASTGVPEALTAANVRTIINVENGADVTDTANVTSAGALMDSEVDADLKTFALPANTTISDYGATLVDDADAGTARSTLGLVIGTNVQAYDANNATATSTTTFTNKTIDANGTGNSISNLEVADFTAAAVVTETDTIAANDNDTTIPTSAAVKAYADGTWWEELGRTTLGSAGDTITVSSLPARKHLMIIADLIASGSIASQIQFNADTGSNYSWRRSVDGAADATTTSGTQISLTTATISVNQSVTCRVLNVAGREKMVSVEHINLGAAGAGTAPSRAETVGKWANTSNAITRVDVFNTQSGDFAIGSEVVVLGHD